MPRVTYSVPLTDPRARAAFVVAPVAIAWISAGTMLVKLLKTETRQVSGRLGRCAEIRTRTPQRQNTGRHVPRVPPVTRVIDLRIDGVAYRVEGSAATEALYEALRARQGRDVSLTYAPGPQNRVLAVSSGAEPLLTRGRVERKERRQILFYLAFGALWPLQGIVRLPK